jgi:hypothetical protein
LLFAPLVLFWILAIPSRLSVVGLGRCFCLLSPTGFVSDLNEKRDMALYHLKASEEFDAAVREWEQKSAASKTWTKNKSFIATEYARENKQNKLTTKQYKANAMEE